MEHKKLDKYYKSRIHASSIIIIRPLPIHEREESQRSGQADFQMLLMKRNQNIIFGGFYAFSGGKVESQDLYEYWLENYPEMFKKFNRKFYDFNARICAIRETFEEINLLIATSLDQNQTIQSHHFLRDEYDLNYKQNFLEFCKAKKLVPDLQRIYGYRRVSTGYEFFPGIDNQFYLYFTNEKDIEKYIQPIKYEFVNAKWLSPQQALDKYYLRKLPLLLPQILCIFHLTQFQKYNELEKTSQDVFDTNIVSYSSSFLTTKRLDKLPQSMREKAVQQFCDEEDLKSDNERDIYAFNNPNYPKIIKIIQNKKTYKDLGDLFSQICIGTLPGDFYDLNDGFPILSTKKSRRRVYLSQQGEIIRFEITPNIREMVNKHHIAMSKL